MKYLEDYNWSTFRILSILVVSALILQILDAFLIVSPYSKSQIVGYSALNLLAVLLITHLGVFLATRADLPILTRPNLFTTALIGSGIAIFAVGLDFIAFDGAIVRKVNNIDGLTSRFALAYTAAVGEETLFRLFVLSLIVVVSKKYISNRATLLISLILSAGIFALAHVDISNLSLSNVLRAILLNGSAGLVFGWLFWRQGLIAAMLAHFAADVVIYVLFPVYWRVTGVT